MASAAASPWSRKVNLTGIIHLESLVLTEDREDGLHIYTLRTVEKMDRTGLWLREYDALVQKPSVHFPPHAVYFLVAQPVAALTKAGTRVWALYDLAQTDCGLAPGASGTAADWTSVYYPASVARSQKAKGILPPGTKLLTFLGRDGKPQMADDGTPAPPWIVPVEALLANEDKPFPGIIVPGPVTQAHLDDSIRFMEEQKNRAAAPAAATPIATSHATVTAPAGAAAAAATVTPVAGLAATPSPAAASFPASFAARAASPATLNAAVAPSHAQAAAAVKIEPTVAAPPPATAASSSLAPPSSVAAPPSLSVSVGSKRARDEETSPAATPGGSTDALAPVSPSLARERKRARKLAKKEAKAAAALREAQTGVLSTSWEVAWPPEPHTLPAKDQWTLDALKQVVPALRPVAVHSASAVGANGTDAGGVKREAALAAAATQAQSIPSAAEPTTEAAAAPSLLASHPLLQSLQSELAQFDIMQRAKREEEDAATGKTDASSAATSDAEECPFLAFRTPLGTLLFDQLQTIPVKELKVAPYVIDL